MTIAVVCSLAAILIASLIFFIAGFLCGRLRRQHEPEQPVNHNGEARPPVDEEIYSQPMYFHNALYEDIPARSHHVYGDDNLVLKENVAYGPGLQAMSRWQSN